MERESDELLHTVLVTRYGPRTSCQRKRLSFRSQTVNLQLTYCILRFTLLWTIKTEFPSYTTVTSMIEIEIPSLTIVIKIVIKFVS